MTAATRLRGVLLALIRAGALALAIAVVARTGAAAFVHLPQPDVVALLAALALLIAVLRANVPALWVAHGRRGIVEPARVAFELPLMLVAGTLFHPAIAAAMQLCAHPIAVCDRGGVRIWRGIVEGGSYASMWIALAWLHAQALPGSPAFSFGGFAAFAAFFFAGTFLALMLYWLPLKRLTQPQSLKRAWSSLLGDTRLFAYVVLAVTWGYVCVMVWVRAGTPLALAMLAPLPLLARGLRSHDAARRELHRLKLARDAVRAMLRTDDALPQMNSLLAGLHTPAAEETLQIYAALGSHNRLTPLAAIGPIPSPEHLRHVRTVLNESARKRSRHARAPPQPYRAHGICGARAGT